ncbi:RNA pyrophosphohydrolase [Kordiimonas sp. SCSIO 12610]|uniref:RNA pyrophosphohydrolase n=1 Tax=Kordiimonas sp. SCSIO 12610 TaxID=2829597 RepID=UPI00210CD3D6|nr:RNA pyrophosphohydrolase [Kordiimonas sp. SCSIO 12610]UTW55821.1 RNA pyrophosphohydrolase [Kordiimonas sp. SCSIO 12610]
MPGKAELENLPYRPCVGIMLINEDGQIFTAERLDKPGAWQMPQGGIDKGEDIEAAALRELEEETSVKPSDVKILAKTSDWISYDLPDHLVGKMWGGKFKGQKQQWYLMQLVASEHVIDLDVDHPEFAKWKWSSKHELIDEIVPFKQDVYKSVLRAFKQYLD